MIPPAITMSEIQAKQIYIALTGFLVLILLFLAGKKIIASKIEMDDNTRLVMLNPLSQALRLREVLLIVEASSASILWHYFFSYANSILLSR